MHILLLTAYFPPDVGSASHLFYELGKALVERGHDVMVATGLPSYHAQGDLSRYQGKLWLSETIDGMRVARVAVPQLLRDTSMGRGLWQFSCAGSLLLRSLSLPRPEVALIYSPPLPLGLTGWALKKLRGTPFILNVQDLVPQSLIDLGILRSGVLIRLLEGLERFVYREADHITVHSKGNRKHVLSKGINPDRVTVVPNWVDTDFIRPGERLNGFRREYELGDRFVVSFAGVMGRSQDLDTILESAAMLRRYEDILFLLIGDGVERKRLERKAKRMGLTNVRFLPMQPRDKYPAVLQASDVSLATLRREVETPVVPSKILSIMASGRPVVAAMRLDGDAPRLIHEARCGYCVEAERADRLSEAILKLYQAPSLRRRLGANGRRYAVQRLSVKAHAERYEALFRRIAGEC